MTTVYEKEYYGKAEYNETYYAYALGYYHGRNDGVEDNPFDPNDLQRFYYKRGYDRGIVDYCYHELDGQYDFAPEVA